MAYEDHTDQFYYVFGAFAVFLKLHSTFCVIAWRNKEFFIYLFIFYKISKSYGFGVNDDRVFIFDELSL